MIQRDRAAHSVMFCGEKGSGRKLMAKYYTASLLCEAPENGVPCGSCPACRMVDSFSHPDVTVVPTSGKLGGYSVETARSVCSDAFIKPNNNTGKKVYLFFDCRKMDPRTQNTLLKLIEEPPDYAYFIFTAESKYEFLPTIISRCCCFGVSPCTGEESAAALRESGFSEKEISAAVSCFHGNIGRCTEYIVDESLRKQVDLTKRIADSIIRRDEYELNSAFFAIGSDRDSAHTVLSMTDLLVRDAAVLSKDSAAGAAGCHRDSALRLSQVISAYQAARIHSRIEKAWSAIESNVSIPLVFAALCCEIINIAV